MMSISAHKNLTNPPGQIVNKRGVLSDNAKSLSDVITRVKDMEMMQLAPTKQETLEEAYAKGYADGVKEGFKQGIAWVKGI